MSPVADCRPALHGAISRLSSTWAWPTARPVANSNAGLKFDDLLQESRVGLIRGLERFDPQRRVKPSSYLLSRATGQILHYRRDRSRIIRIPWRLRDLYAAGMKIQREREQNQQALLSDLELAGELSVRPKRWAAAVQSHGTSQVVDLSASPGEPASSKAADEHLDLSLIHI